MKYIQYKLSNVYAGGSVQLKNFTISGFTGELSSINDIYINQYDIQPYMIAQIFNESYDKSIYMLHTYKNEKFQLVIIFRQVLKKYFQDYLKDFQINGSYYDSYEDFENDMTYNFLCYDAFQDPETGEIYESFIDYLVAKKLILLINLGTDYEFIDYFGISGKYKITYNEIQYQFDLYQHTPQQIKERIIALYPQEYEKSKETYIIIQ